MNILIKELRFLSLLPFLLLALAGCSGGGSDSRPVYEANILSDQPADGDIAYDPVLLTYTITDGPSTLFFGIDALNPNRPEYRAFLDFPLNGSTGASVVPSSTTITSATLEVFVNEVSFSSKVPTLIDLVSYHPSGLRLEDFSSQPLLSMKVNFFPVDQGTMVSIDVTTLMQEAQRLGLPELQLRILLDLAVSNGFVGLEDRRTVALTAPMLRVNYIY